MPWEHNQGIFKVLQNILLEPLSKWVAFGTDGKEGPARRRVRMMNVLVTLISVISFCYIIFFSLYDFSGLFIPIATLTVFAALFLGTPLINLWSANAGGLYNLPLWMVFSMSIAHFFGAESGLQFYMLAGAASAIAIFGVRQNILSIISITYGVGAFMYADRTFTAPASYLRVDDALINILYFTSIPAALAVIFCMVFFAFRQVNRAEYLLQKEYRYSEQLLATMLPESIAAQLKKNPHQTIANSHESVTILFADIVGFTPRASHQSPAEIVKFLNRLFTRFDTLATNHGLEKIKTLGDAFMVAGGMHKKQDDHAERVARLALDMVAEAESFSDKYGEEIELRIGIHSGPVVAGVIGTKKPFYDVWGDTVNTAARLETFGTNGKIQVTRETKERLQRSFNFERRGRVEVKGKGELELWYLEETRKYPEEEEDPNTSKAAE